MTSVAKISIHIHVSPSDEHSKPPLVEKKEKSGIKCLFLSIASKKNASQLQNNQHSYSCSSMARRKKNFCCKNQYSYHRWDP